MIAETKVVKGAAGRIRDGNPEPRVPCLLLLDVSSSMTGDKIQELNAGLEAFRSDLLNERRHVNLDRLDPLGRLSGDDYIRLSDRITMTRLPIPASND